MKHNLWIKKEDRKKNPSDKFEKAFFSLHTFQMYFGTGKPLPRKLT